MVRFGAKRAAKCHFGAVLTAPRAPHIWQALLEMWLPQTDEVGHRHVDHLAALFRNIGLHGNGVGQTICVCASAQCNQSLSERSAHTHRVSISVVISS